MIPDFSPFHVEKNVPLAPYTIVKIGGPAEFFCEPKTEEEFISAVQKAMAQNVPVTILGRGANVLISDEGIKGLVIHPKNATYSKQPDGSARVGAGMDLGALALKLMDDGFAGSDHLIGIPGTVGGAVYGNAGKGEAGIGAFVKQVQTIERASGKVGWLENAECEFAPRQSVFQQNQYIIIAVNLILPQDKDGKAKEKIREYVLRKNKTQPLSEPTWGCTFRNVNYTPDMGNEKLRNLLNQKRRELEQTNSQDLKRLFDLIDKKNLLPASWLLDQAGCKGLRRGGLVVSDRHANFIIKRASEMKNSVFHFRASADKNPVVSAHKGGETLAARPDTLRSRAQREGFILNQGDGTATDAQTLIQEMKSRVKDEFGIELTEEIRFLGF